MPAVKIGFEKSVSYHSRFQRMLKRRRRLVDRVVYIYISLKNIRCKRTFLYLSGHIKWPLFLIFFLVFNIPKKILVCFKVYHPKDMLKKKLLLNSNLANPNNIFPVVQITPLEFLNY